MKLIAIVVLAAVSATTPAATAQSHTPTRELKQLRNQVQQQRAEITRKATRIEALSKQRNEYAAERDQLRNDLTAMTTARDNALAGLPAAITAVPTDQFWTLVFSPARATWPCDSYYSSSGYWSLDFTSC